MSRNRNLNTSLNLRDPLMLPRHPICWAVTTSDHAVRRNDWSDWYHPSHDFAARHPENDLRGSAERHLDCIRDALYSGGSKKRRLARISDILDECD